MRSGEFGFIDKHIGTRIRKRRLELDLPQREIAAALGVSYQQIQKFENAKNSIRAAQLWCHARELDVPLEWFFESD